MSKVHRGRAGALAGAAIVVFVAAGEARAASKQAKDQCRTVGTLWKEAPRMLPLGTSVDPMEAPRYAENLRQQQTFLGLVEKALAKVPAGESIEGDPELAACASETETRRAYVRKLTPLVEEANEKAKTVRPFLDKNGTHNASFVRLASVAIDPSVNVYGTVYAQRVRLELDGLAQVEKSCAASGIDGSKLGPAKSDDDDASRVGQSSYGVVLGSRFLHAPENWCYVATHRIELARRASANREYEVEGYGNFQAILPIAAEKLSADHPDLDGWVASMVVDTKTFYAKLRAASAQWYRDLGLGAANEVVDPPGLDAKIRAVAARIDEVAPNVSFPKSSVHAPAFESLAAARVKADFPKATVKRSFMDALDWKIEKNDLGLPTHRFQSGRILFQRAGVKWCEMHGFSVVEPYAGGGKFQPSKSAEILQDTTFMRCD